MDELIDLLHSGRHSLVVRSLGVSRSLGVTHGAEATTGANVTHGTNVTCPQIHTFDGRGVQDLYRLLSKNPEVLNGASVADKVVGKGAAALMVLGKVQEVFAHLISTPALALLREAGVSVRFNQEVPYIINRQGSGPCPVETLCQPCATAEECLPKIEGFVDKTSNRRRR